MLKIEAPNEPFYWRATTLDAFVGDNWKEDLDSAPAPAAPPEHRKGLVRQVVTVEALRDPHLIGAELPVGFSSNGASAGTSTKDRVTFGFSDSEQKTYVAWSSVQRPTPRQLARSKPSYPMEIGVDQGVVVPPVRDSGPGHRRPRVLASSTAPYAPLYAAAKQIIGRAKNPYAAVVAIESWLRDSGRSRTTSIRALSPACRPSSPS